MNASEWMTAAPTDPIYYRNPILVATILAHIHDAAQPVPWNELVEQHTPPDGSYRTIERILYQLLEHGAICRVGRPPVNKQQPDTRALKPTFLGRCWLEQEHPPRLGGNTDDETND